MSTENEKKQAAEYLAELAEQQGVAVSSVKDGYILLFKRERMQELIDQYPDKPMLLIFVQKPTFQN